jgi:hypothetical protein
MFVRIATVWFLVSLAAYVGLSWLGFYALWHTVPSLPDLVFSAVVWGGIAPGLPLAPFVAAEIVWPFSVPNMAWSMVSDVATMSVGLAVNSILWAALLTGARAVVRRRRELTSHATPPSPSAEARAPSP